MSNISGRLPPSLSMEQHAISYDLEDLNQILLEKDAKKYLDVLNYLSNHLSKEVVRDVLNQTTYDTWYSNHVLALAHLVGKLNNYENGRGYYENGSGYYGCELKEGISEELGIKILDKMMTLGVDIWDTNYYDDTIITIINDNKLLGSRCGNDLFKVKVHEYYNRETN